MKKHLILTFINMLFLTEVMATTANCLNGKCEFISSNHYKYATTYCLQTLNYEKVETNFLYFTILEKGEKCDVLESIQ